MIDKFREAWKVLPIAWLLGGEPFVRYRALTDLLYRQENDPEVLDARSSIIGYAPIKRILDRQNADGSWGNPADIYAWWPRKDTTFWLLGILGDFGLDRSNPQIAAACEYVFGTQLPCGGFGWAPPPTPADCFTGILVESLAKLGYESDPRLQNAFRWLLNRQRFDGGFWCKNTGLPGGPREREPSCAFATLCVMGAMARSPELRNSKVVSRGLEFLLQCWENRGKIKYAGHDSKIGQGWEKLKYPYTDYRILKYLEVLSGFESIRRDLRMREMTDLIISKLDKLGRCYAESIHQVWADFDFGQKKMPSRWITFLTYRIISRFIT